MEDIVGSFVDLARAEIQRNDLVGSELIVLLKYTEERMYCNEFMVYDIDSPRFTTATVASFPRFTVPVEHPTDEGEAICGALIKSTTVGTTPATLLEQADNKLEEWLTCSVDWVQVAQQQPAMQSTTAEDLTPLLLVRPDGVVFWRVEAICEYVNILHWFRDYGSKRFPSSVALRRVWLRRSLSNAFQERVFSTGGGDFVMSNLRTRTENELAEMQVLLKHNRDEIKSATAM
ncbi:hypothetical protein PR001_g2753 [Phytophthora rubi]|uniref:HAT C-terminal dimerisation domain-containing protein n=1 Tax=Phytophthora rubi TaxID=129364 RepID=A0A6A3P8T3_9STRA|nr:hypothetical protein PR001_g2753 [Phytophthora rubi]